jgi:hypothetical protein
MSGSLIRVNFWGVAIPHEVHRSAQRVLVSNGLLDPSKVTATRGNILATSGCTGDGGSCDSE